MEIIDGNLDMFADWCSDVPETIFAWKVLVHRIVKAAECSIPKQSNGCSRAH